MAISYLNKLEAARRQICLAIRLSFEGEDTLGIHTIAHASFRLLENIADKRGKSCVNEVLLVTSQSKNSLWRSMNFFANFLKHADRDTD